MQKLQEDIYTYLGYKIKMFKAKKHQTSLNKCRRSASDVATTDS